MRAFFTIKLVNIKRKKKALVSIIALFPPFTFLKVKNMKLMKVHLW